MSRSPIAEDLFTWPSAEPALIAGRCTNCAAVTFPVRDGCARCGHTPLERELLERDGILWSWTSQGFRPKAPFSGNLGGDTFTPWYVGLVELGGRIRVESLLCNVTEDQLEIGMPVRMTVIPFRFDDPGHEIVTFAFEPVAAHPTTHLEVSHA